MPWRMPRRRMPATAIVSEEAPARGRISARTRETAKTGAQPAARKYPLAENFKSGRRAALEAALAQIEAQIQSMG